MVHSEFTYVVHGEAVRQWNALRTRPAILWGGSMSLACTGADTPDKPPTGPWTFGLVKRSAELVKHRYQSLRSTGGTPPAINGLVLRKREREKGSEWQINRASRANIYSRKGRFLVSPYKEDCRNHVLKFEEQYQKLLQSLGVYLRHKQLC